MTYSGANSEDATPRHGSNGITNLNNIDPVYNMRVLKRNLQYEEVKFDKITTRIAHLCGNLQVSPMIVAQRAITNMYDGISTEELDHLSAKAAEALKHTHADYGKLAANIVVSNLHKTTPDTFSNAIEQIYASGTLSQRHYDFIIANRDALDNMIIDNNDYLFDYFGYKTLESTYLCKRDEPVLSNGLPIYLHNGDVVDNDNVEIVDDKPYIRVPMTTININGTLYDIRGRKIVSIMPTMLIPLSIKTKSRLIDRPQYIFMRVAIAIWLPRDNASDALTISSIKHSYEQMSHLLFTHATPTLFNACMRQQQLGSCFLLGTADSLDGIMKTVVDCARISKGAGGIGIHMSNIRSANSIIKSSNGRSSGLPRQIKIYNEVACTWDQGGRRKGSFAVYIEPWHADILNVLRMKLSHGDEAERARDIFYGLWVPDLFTYCAKNQLQWSLFSEDTAPGLSDVFDGMLVCDSCSYCHNPAYALYFGSPTNVCKDNKHNFVRVDAFTELYTRYEQQGRAVGSVNATEIMDAICKLQREAGVPYVCHKDAVNRMSNQSGIGTIKSSNLCTEIMEYSDDKSYACCTLSSINLRMFVRDNDIDHVKLHEVVKLMVRHLDRVIDNNDYPVIECKANSYDYRPIGIGVQGLANVFAMLRIPFLSDNAARIDNEIFETIYHAAVSASCDLAEELGSFVGFEKSPAAQGILAPDLYVECMCNGDASKSPYTGRYDFDALRARAKRGMRNPLLIALMPTMSTSSILGNNESFEPFHANIFTKTTIAGKFTLTNTTMLTHLQELGIYNDSIMSRIAADRGSVQNIAEIPADVKEIYKTVWELPQSEIMNRAAARYAWVDQAQSLNIHLADNSSPKLRAVYFHGAALKLKTGSYYIRTRPAVDPTKSNVLANAIAVAQTANNQPNNDVVCTNEEGCFVCSS